MSEENRSGVDKLQDYADKNPGKTVTGMAVLAVGILGSFAAALDGVVGPKMFPGDGRWVVAKQVGRKLAEGGRNAVDAVRSRLPFSTGVAAEGDAAQSASLWTRASGMAGRAFNAVRSRLPTFGRGAASAAEGASTTAAETGATVGAEVAGETVLGAALEGGAAAGGTVGVAGGFEIPVWGWIATGVAAVGGVGYGVYRHYHNQHEADASAKKQGFKNSAEAADAAKAGFKNSDELHFMDEWEKKEGHNFTGVADAAQKLKWNSLPEFVAAYAKQEGVKDGHELVQKLGYLTPNERANNAAKEQGFKDSAEAVDAAKAGFQNSDELHFMDEWEKRNHPGMTGFADAAQKKNWNSMPEFAAAYAKQEGVKDGHELAQKLGYLTPAERAAQSTRVDNAEQHSTPVAATTPTRAAQADNHTAGSSAGQHGPAHSTNPPSHDEIVRIQKDMGLDEKRLTGEWDKETNQAAQKLILQAQSTDAYKGKVEGLYGPKTQTGLDALLHDQTISPEQANAFKSLGAERLSQVYTPPTKQEIQAIPKRESQTPAAEAPPPQTATPTSSSEAAPPIRSVPASLPQLTPAEQEAAFLKAAGINADEKHAIDGRVQKLGLPDQKGSPINNIDDLARAYGSGGIAGLLADGKSRQFVESLAHSYGASDNVHEWAKKLIAANTAPAPVPAATQLPVVASAPSDTAPPPSGGGNRPDYRRSLGNNLANDGTGKVDALAIQNEGDAKVRQWDANGMHMAVVDVKDHGRHVVDTSVTSAAGTRTTHTVDGKMQWSVVRLEQPDGTVVVASDQQRDKKGNFVEHAKADALALVRNNAPGL